jgi:hypothetical protein
LHPKAFGSLDCRRVSGGKLRDRRGSAVAAIASGIAGHSVSGYPPSMWGEHRNAGLIKLGSDGVSLLQKPFLPAQLLSTVDKLIGPPAKGSYRSASV